MANTGGAETHTLTTTEMPSHNHGVNDPSHSHTYQTFDSIGQAIGNVNGTNAGGRYYNQNSFGAYTGISIQNAGGNGAHNNMQPYVVVNFIIKT
jgi:microcystin-dependent protein